MWGIRQELTTAGEAQYFEITKSPLADMETVAEIEAYDWPRVEEVVLPDVPPGVDLQATHRRLQSLAMSGGKPVK